MDKSEVFEFIDRFEGSDLTVFEYEDNGLRIRLEKSGTIKEAAPVVDSELLPPRLRDEGAPVISAPLVGVFYRAASPGASPFAEVGGELSKGAVLCVIEAMKVMNEIKAPYDLKIKRILVADGDMVDCGKALFEVEKC